MKKIPFLLSVISLSLLSNSTFTVGKTYEIAEPDMIEAIQKHIQDNHEKIEKKYEEMKTLTQEKINNMTPTLTKSIHHARKNREFIANTLYENQSDIKDNQGKILYHKGYKYDPMDYIQLPYSIVFINGENKQEIEWLKKSDMLNTAAFRILITNGKYADVTKAIGQNIFFATDQILNRLNIEATPSIATQVGNKLKITEVCVECNQTDE